jgi:hypothetical protein
VESLTDLLVLVRRAAIVPHDFHDRAVSSLLKRMLALQPADRAHAIEVVHALERIRERPMHARRRVQASLVALLSSRS